MTITAEANHKIWAARLVATVLALFAAGTSATIYNIDLSPAAGTALNLGGVNLYNGDHAVGLAALNEMNQPGGATGTGNEINNGIFYDDVTNVLTFDIGYGSLHLFADLAGQFTLVEIHGPSAVQFPSPNVSVVPSPHNLTPFHSPAGFTTTGTITGTVVLSAQGEFDLFDNELYIHIHSGFQTNGEIRRQLIAVIPIPAPVWLLVVPLLGLVGLRRRVP